jgi:hypothetical protein
MQVWKCSIIKYHSLTYFHNTMGTHTILSLAHKPPIAGITIIQAKRILVELNHLPRGTAHPRASKIHGGPHHIVGRPIGTRNNTNMLNCGKSYKRTNISNNDVLFSSLVNGQLWLVIWQEITFDI